MIAQRVSQAMKEHHSFVEFVAGETPIPVAGKVFGEPELTAAAQASLDFWLTAGHYTESFESRLVKTVGMRHSFMVNSGSSANLIP